MRLAVYGATSTAVAVGVVLSAFQRRPNFYSACVYLAQSNACLMVLANTGIFITVLFGRIVQSIFFGSLRVIEIEHLYEKTWYAVTETCLAMTIFRDEFDARFLVMFTTLLFLKIFHWLASDRVEYMEQTAPASATVFHIRVTATLTLLNLVDIHLIRYALDDILTRGPSMMVMFAFEFAILVTTAMATAGRYVLSLIELRVVARSSDEVDGWERKGEFLFYLDLVTDFVKLFIYLGFFLLILTVYGLPLHIIRDVYLTMRSFLTRIRDFLRYRQATSQMNNRYPDATEEEVAREPTCIICREDMVVPVNGPDQSSSTTQPERMRPKKLPCGHVLHFGCLRSWLERQQRCPTCRRPVLDSPNRPSSQPPVQQQQPQQPQEPPHQPGAPAPGASLAPHNSQAAAAGPNASSQPSGPAQSSTSQPGSSEPPRQVTPEEQSFFTPHPEQSPQQPVVLPQGFQLPQGWAILPLRQFANGLQQIQIRDNVWVTLATVQYVMPLANGMVTVPPVDPLASFGTPTASAVPNAAAAAAAPAAASAPPATSSSQPSPSAQDQIPESATTLRSSSPSSASASSPTPPAPSDPAAT
ncbi:hypothetical protein V1525DRAFT_394111 [Lipomyces kononenkoae]|uniref:Uncharacterized protein n=1 Tax=Lipomyces kononenkoae TaxID=34357 RepID=A0ACC3TBC9_LIPKO